jgi:phosphoribosylcarboxyaminoimidazole (NCAIR) mutase
MAPWAVRGDMTASTAEKTPSTLKMIRIQERSLRVRVRFAAAGRACVLPSMGTVCTV